MANLIVGTGGYSTIQAAIDAASSGDTISVEAGTYNENLTINKSLTLVSQSGAGSTTIVGQGSSALGTILVTPGVNNVTIGGIGQGFTIQGIDNASPGIESAAIYLQGAHDGLTIQGNNVVANGDAGLTSEFGQAITNTLIDSNEFSGQTFAGPEPAGTGFSQQFTLANVPRQLVVLGGNVAGDIGLTPAGVTFTNNDVTGTAGGTNSGGQQGNTLVTIDVPNSVITDNTFTGFTNLFASQLRVREENTTVENNSFSSPLGGNIGVFAQFVAPEAPGSFNGNSFEGNGSANTIFGTFGNDELEGGGGSDALIGGAGTDTATFAGTLTAANFAADVTDADPVTGGNQAGWTVTSSGGDGTDTVTGIEKVTDGSGNTFLLVGNGGFATIQEAVNAAANGDTILVAAGTYTEDVTVTDKAIAIVGAGPGVNINGQFLVSDAMDTADVMRFENLNINADGKSYGISVRSSATDVPGVNGGSIVLDGVSISNANEIGFFYAHPSNGSNPINPNTVGTIEILNSTFTDNGHLVTGARGQGHVNLFGFNGNLTVDDVTMTGPAVSLGDSTFRGGSVTTGNDANPDKAFTITGIRTGTPGVGGYVDAGNLVLNDVTVSGNYSTDVMSFYTIQSFATASIANVAINARGPWGLVNFDSVSGPIDLTGVTGTNLAAGIPIVVMQGLSGGDAFTGTAGNDVLWGRGGDDTLSGGGGNDTINGSAGTDAIDGGAGIDTAVYSDDVTVAYNGTKWVVTSAADGTETLTNVEIIDDLTGGSLYLVGGGGFASVGDALAAGATLADIVTAVSPGGTGDDIILAQAGNQMIDGGKGNDTVDYSAATSGVTVDLSTKTGTSFSTETGLDTLINIENVTGGAGSDFIKGSTTANVINGAGGADTIFAGGGNDTVLGGDGNDVMFGEAGNDTLDGGSGDDTIDGGAGNDIILGGADNDKLFGNAGNDTLKGDAGADQLDGGLGNDTIYADGADTFVFGGGGTDTLIVVDAGGMTVDLTAASFEKAFGDAGADILDATGSKVAVTIDGGGGADDLSGGNMADKLYGGLGADDLFGNAGNDLLDGGADVDSLNGGAGTDTLLGGAGADTLIGEAGNDRLYGNNLTKVGDGAIDTYVFGAVWGRDTIYDFEDGVDQLDFSSFGALADDLSDFTITQSGKNVVIRLDGDKANTVTLVNMTVANITADDFNHF